MTVLAVATDKPWLFHPLYFLVFGLPGLLILLHALFSPTPNPTTGAGSRAAGLTSRLALALLALLLLALYAAAIFLRTTEHTD